jgi:AraC-like DNA-binding protein
MIGLTFSKPILHAVAYYSCHITQYDIENACHAKTVIEKDLSRHHTYQDLARMLGTSVSKLQKSFKIVTGSNLYEYLTIIRVDQAIWLLTTTELKIDVIAYKVGWDRSNLNKQFKKIKGKSPRDWRNEQGNKNVSFKAGVILKHKK